MFARGKYIHKIKMRHILIFCLLSQLGMASCVASETHHALNTKHITAVNVLETGSDEPNAFCKDFKLTVRDAVQYFKKSRTITITQLHDNYEYLPCYVRGTATLDGSICKWEIRAGATAEIHCNNQHTILACDECDALFQ